MARQRSSGPLPMRCGKWLAVVGGGLSSLLLSPPCSATPAAACDAPFQCPERLASDGERSAAQADFWRWVAARRPAWTQEDGLACWRRLLAAHGCTGVFADSVVVTGAAAATADGIVPRLGATVHTLGPDEIAAVPQGEDAPLQQVVLRNPGVVEDSFGELHVRGEHGNVQYRINGALLPESLNGFAQEVDTHFVESVTLADGALPAEFGFRTSAVIDVTTKSGARLAGGEVGLYGGSHGLLQPTAQIGNQAGPLSYYAAASYKQTGLGIEGPTASADPLHDDSAQARASGLLAWQLDPSHRLSLLASATGAEFQIPDVRGQTPIYAVAGLAPPGSAALDERQHEQNDYVVAAYQATTGDGLHYDLAGFTRYGRIAFTPDLAGDLAFSGVASRVEESFLSTGLQLDASQPVGDSHTVRAGTLLSRESAALDTESAVFAAAATGRQLSDVPEELADAGVLRGWLAGLYLQDEWRAAPRLTINGGLRADLADAVRRESQLSPRLNAVWQAGAATAVHLGYARYFTPPSLQYEPPAAVAQFAGTTNAPTTLADSPPRAERADYYDAGLTRQLAPGVQVSLDAFDKLASNLIDLGQFGRAVILAPFNYRRGRIHGAELAATARTGGLSLYANAAYVFTQARDITSAQFEFPAAELAYVAAHDIRLDHEGEVAATAGAAYGWGGTRAFADILFCSGLRRGFANLGKLPAYHPLDLGVERTLPLPASWKAAVKLRLDLLNAFDEIYELRDGTGIGIAAAQYGPRRSLYGGISTLF
jgi:outer membrane receptor protein involved in Fe transport